MGIKGNDENPQGSTLREKREKIILRDSLPDLMRRQCNDRLTERIRVRG